jgi:hypothetical protein
VPCIGASRIAWEFEEEAIFQTVSNRRRRGCSAVCCTYGGESVGGREHAGAFQGGGSLVSRWRWDPSIPPVSSDVSCFFAWLSMNQVADDSVMVCRLPSESAVSYLSTAYFSMCGIFWEYLRRERFVDPADPRFALLRAPQRFVIVRVCPLCGVPRMRIEHLERSA